MRGGDTSWPDARSKDSVELFSKAPSSLSTCILVSRLLVQEGWFIALIQDGQAQFTMSGNSPPLAMWSLIAIA